MAKSRARLPASTATITSKSRVRRTAATSSASFFGLKRTRLGFLYWELPTTSATRRSAKAAPAETAARRTPHRAATHARRGLLIATSGCSAFRVPSYHQMRRLAASPTDLVDGRTDGRPAAGRRHHDLYRLGINRGFMRQVILVTEQQLEGMLAERKRDLRLGLSRSEVQVIEVIRNRLVQRRQRGVDHEMVVGGIDSRDAAGG